ncbi:helix-turn-helix domain-containing protein [Arvimicrobium flavum]|uniref:helix-turn-helix domain-containing protein n=1 Tax=Arvimicrobium flavum TaxID=3393320 RepID=UPI00237C0DF0|nr:helix-turn-helix transcriptional regulator [Mesorhizobium shangrilense]
MSSNTQHVEHQLRREGGAWLKNLRENVGLTQRAFSVTVGTDYYTFISQIENGRGRVPPERYKVWAEVLKVDPKEFMQGLMRYYDPYGYEMLFGEFPQPRDVGDDKRNVA